jgi:hypothetical protein
MVLDGEMLFIIHQCGDIKPRHCEERSDEAIHFLIVIRMDCFASLAMTEDVTEILMYNWYTRMSKVSDVMGQDSAVTAAMRIALGVAL